MWSEIFDRRLDEIRAADRWRQLRPLTAGTGDTVLCDTGEHLVSFASNDYLGLSQHPWVRRAAVETIGRYGTGAGSSRLIVGSRSLHHELEHALAQHKKAEAALVFPTGYQANLGALGAICAASSALPVLICDELNHASLIDGSRLARAQIDVYRHGDTDHAEALLRKHRGRPAVIVTDSVFSMDGDLAPIGRLSALAAQHRALLLLDDAHDVFEDLEEPHPGCTVVRVGTLSKTLGSLGGFVTGSRPLVHLLVNTARSGIFTTAPTPAQCAAALTAIELVEGSEGERLRSRLRGYVDTLAPGHPTAILPVLLGEEHRALEVANELRARGMLVPAIRPPTVPPGSSRLRITLSALHSREQIQALADALTDLQLTPGLAEMRSTMGHAAVVAAQTDPARQDSR